MKTQENTKYKIWIDTTARESSIVRVTDIESEEVLSEIVVDDPDALVSSLGRLLSDLSIDLRSAEFEAAPGPGSFTALKKGHTISNVLNWANGAAPQNLKYPEYGAEPNVTI